MCTPFFQQKELKALRTIQFDMGAIHSIGRKVERGLVVAGLLGVLAGFGKIGYHEYHHPQLSMESQQRYEQERQEHFRGCAQGAYLAIASLLAAVAATSPEVLRQKSKKLGMGINSYRELASEWIPVALDFIPVYGLWRLDHLRSATLEGLRTKEDYGNLVGSCQIAVLPFTGTGAAFGFASLLPW